MLERINRVVRVGASYQIGFAEYLERLDDAHNDDKEGCRRKPRPRDVQELAERSGAIHRRRFVLFRRDVGEAGKKNNQVVTGVLPKEYGQHDG